MVHLCYVYMLVMFLKQQEERRQVLLVNTGISLLLQFFSHRVACTHTHVFTHCEHILHLQLTSDSMGIFWVTWSDDAVLSV